LNFKTGSRKVRTLGESNVVTRSDDDRKTIEVCPDFLRFSAKRIADGWLQSLHEQLSGHDPFITPNPPLRLTAKRVNIVHSAEQLPFGPFCAGVSFHYAAFNSLPLELCSAITEHLSTSDVLNTSLWSRSFRNREAEAAKNVTTSTL
jgi:hypothetical protein